MPGDQEGDDLVADVLQIQGGAVGRMRRGEHQPQQVLRPAGGSGRRGRAGGDDLVDHTRQVVGVGAHRRVALVVVDTSGAADTGHRPLQAAHHRADERVRLVAVEGAEVEAESGEPDGVQRHPCHVVGHLHRIPGGGLAVPGFDEPVSDLQHHRLVGAHRPQAEGGHENVVRLGPVGLVGVRGEQPVAQELAQVLHPEPDVLGESLIVGELGDEVQPGDEEVVLAVRTHSEDRAQVPGRFHQPEDGRAGRIVGGEVDDGHVCAADCLRRKQGIGHGGCPSKSGFTGLTPPRCRRLSPPSRPRNAMPAPPPT